MSWNHILLEGHCAFNNEKGGDSKFCKYKPGRVGLHCLNLGDNNKKICQYFRYCKAVASIVLTDNTGEAVAYQAYDFPEELTNEEDILKDEKKWIKIWKQKLLDDSNS